MSSYFKSMWDTASNITNKISSMESFKDPKLLDKEQKDKKDIKAMEERHKEELEKFKAEIDKMTTDMKSDMELQRQENTNLKSENERLLLEIQNLKNSLDNQTLKAREAENAKDLAVSEKKILEESLGKAEETNNRLIKEIETLKTKVILHESKEQSGQVLKSVVDLQNAISSSNLKDGFIEDFDSKFKLITCMVEDENFARKLSDQLEQILAKLLEKLKEKEGEGKEVLIEVIKAEIIDKKIEEEALSLIQEKLDSDLKQLFVKADTIISECNYKSINSTLQDDLKNLEDKLNNLVKENNEVIVENARVKSSILQSEQQIESNQTRIKLLENENSSMGSDLKSVKETLSQRQEEINSLLTEKKSLSDYVAERDQRILQLEIAKGKLEDEIKCLKREIEAHIEEKKRQNAEIEEMNSRYEKTAKISGLYKESLRQILSKILDEPYFKEVLTKCLADDLTEEKFFNEIYRVSTFIQPKCISSYLLNIFKPDLLKRLKALNINEKIDSLSKISKLQSPSELMDYNEKFCGTEFMTEIFEHLTSSVELMTKATTDQAKCLSEHKEQIKTLKENLEDAKKNEIERVDALNKQVDKLKQDVKDHQKTEKLQKENLESVEASLKDLKSEIAKLNEKNKVLNQSKLDSIKEVEQIRDKLITTTQKYEDLRVENHLLGEKVKKNEEDTNSSKELVRRMSVEKIELSDKLLELDKLARKIEEKEAIIKEKEKELEVIKTSYKSLEELLNHVKESEAKSAEEYKQQIIDLTEKIDEKEKEVIALEDKCANNQANEHQVRDLKEALFELEQQNIRLKEQRDQIKRNAEDIVNKVKKDLKDTEYLMDKRIINDFLFKYFDKTKNEKIKQSLLEYFANIMGYNNDERRLIGLSASSYSSNTTTTSSSTNDKLKEISDDLYNFVLNA